MKYRFQQVLWLFLFLPPFVLIKRGLISCSLKKFIWLRPAFSPRKICLPPPPDFRILSCKNPSFLWLTKPFVPSSFIQILSEPHVTFFFFPPVETWWFSFPPTPSFFYFWIFPPFTKKPRIAFALNLYQSPFGFPPEDLYFLSPLLPTCVGKVDSLSTLPFSPQIFWGRQLIQSRVVPFFFLFSFRIFSKNLSCCATIQSLPSDLLRLWFYSTLSSNSSSSNYSPTPAWPYFHCLQSKRPTCSLPSFPMLNPITQSPYF